MPKLTLQDINNTVPHFRRKKTAEEWCRAKYPWIEWDLRDCHLEMLNPTLQSFFVIANDFPEVAKEVKAVKFIAFDKAFRDKMGIGRNVPAMTRCSTGEILFSSRFFSKMCNFFLCRWANIKSGWYPAGTSSYGSFMTHEFAHRILYWIDDCNEYVYAPDGHDHAHCVMDAWLMDHDAHISEYGATDYDEYFAEAFVEFYNSPNPSVASRNCVAFVNELVRQVREMRAIRAAHKDGKCSEPAVH